MSRYRVLNTATDSLYNVFTTTLNGAATATLIRVNNSDGTVTEIVGSGLTLSGSTATAGTITSITRLTSIGGTVLDSFDTPNAGLADSFVSFWNAVSPTARRQYLLGQADTVEGSSGADTLYGDNGADTIFGGSGADTIYVGASDSVDGSTGDDTFILTMPSGGRTIVGGTGIDTLDASQMTVGGNSTYGDIEVFIGSAFNDGFSVSNTASTQAVTLSGGGGNDTLNGAAGADTFDGGTGDDEFTGHGGADTINGGAGLDIVFYSGETGAGAVFVNLSSAAVTVGALTQAAFTATDRSGATDTLISIEGAGGTSGNDTLIGSSGDDYLRGFGGNDTIDGGAGFDQLVFAGFNGGVPLNGITVTFSGNGGGTVNNDGFGGVDIFTSIERIRGTSFADVVNGDSSNNSFRGLGGNDSFYGGDGFDEMAYDNDANVVGGTGNLTVNLATGTATDGFGNTDTFTSVEGVRGSSGNDTILGSNVSETFIGNGGADSLFGGGGRDFLRGGSGNDTLDGSAGVGAQADQSSGDADWASYNDGGAAIGVVVNLDTGVALDSFGGTDTLIDIERVRGTNFADSITGSNTQNLRQERFEGLGGNDTINGQAGWNVVSYASDAANGGLAGVTVNLTTGTATDGFGNTDTLTNIGGILGTALADNLTGNTANNYFRNNGGADTIAGGDGIDTIELYQLDDQIGGTGATINLATGIGNGFDLVNFTFTSIEAVDGSFRNDTIIGSANADNLFGSMGNDSIDGGDGDDTVSGGAGADTLIGGAGSDWLGYVFDTTDPVQNGLDASANAAFGWLTQNWNWTGVTVNLATGVMSGVDGAVDTFSGFENVFGTYLNDSLTGDGGDNRFRGYAGNDTINGGGGSDTVVYSRTVSRSSGLALANMVGDNPLNINVDLSTGIAQDGNGGTDTLISIENVVGGNGDDTMIGNASVNTFTGGLGNDVYEIQTPADVVIENAGEGTDTIRTSYDSITMAANVENLVFVNYTGATNVLGNAENNLITGTNGQNILNGAGGNDTLIGGSSADALIGGLGADSMTGGDGGDFYYVDNANDVIVEGSGVGSGYDVVTITNGTYTLSANIEQAVLQDGATGVVGNAGANFLYGGNSGLSLNLSGGDGDDILFAGLAGSNTLSGGAGVDTLLIYGGNNQANGGLGSDIYFTYTATDVLSEQGGDGIDTVYATYSITLGDGFEQIILSGSATSATSTSLTDNNIIYGNSTTGAVSLSGGGGSDVLFGGANNDTLNGGSGVDLLFGLGGTNTLIGGDDTDIYYLETAGNTVIETLTGGFDTVYSNVAGTTQLADNVEQLILYGAATGGTGTSGNDYLYGNASALALTLDGGAGNDYLLGSAQDDTLIGGTGNDLFNLAIGGNDILRYTTAGNLGADTILSFDADPAGGQDLISLSGMGYTGASIGSAITIAASGGNTLVTFTSGNLNGTTITLTGVAAANVTATDFQF